MATATSPRRDAMLCDVIRSRLFIDLFFRDFFLFCSRDVFFGGCLSGVLD